MNILLSVQNYKCCDYRFPLYIQCFNGPPIHLPARVNILLKILKFFLRGILVPCI